MNIDRKTQEAAQFDHELSHLPDVAPVDGFKTLRMALADAIKDIKDNAEAGHEDHDA